MSSVIYSNKFVDLYDSGKIRFLRNVRNEFVIQLKWTDDDDDWHRFSLRVNGKWLKGEDCYPEEPQGESLVEVCEQIRQFC